MLRLSNGQEAALAYDVVRRHASRQAREVDGQVSDPGPSPSGPLDVQRVQALAQVLRDDLNQKVPGAAPHLMVDLDLCAAQWAQALEAGAAYRQTGASAQMLACASLGLMWLSDERLGATAPGPGSMAWHSALTLDPAALKAWAEAGWADRYGQALARLKALQVPAVYALDRAAANHFTAASLRTVANTVFMPDQQDRLARFVTSERQLFDAALRHGPGPLDPRLEALCIAADLVHGLGRFVRLATAMRRQMPAAPLYLHLRKAIDELAG